MAYFHPKTTHIETFGLQFSIFICFCKQQLLLAKINYVIYLANNSYCLQKQMKIKLNEVEILYRLVIAILVDCHFSTQQFYKDSAVLSLLNHCAVSCISFCPANSNPRQFPSYLLLTLLLYFLLIFTLVGTLYWIFLLFRPGLPYHFQLVIIK